MAKCSSKGCKNGATLRIPVGITTKTRPVCASCYANIGGEVKANSGTLSKNEITDHRWNHLITINTKD